MSGFTETFGGSIIYPSDVTFLALALTVDTVLSWPIEQQVGGDDIVAAIIEVTAAADGLTVGIPDATQVTTGYTALFNNRGAHTFTVVNAIGGTILTVASGEVWQMYLSDNSTEAGTWRVFQYGAGTSSANAATLAGYGLKAISTTLNQNLPASGKAANYSILDSDRASVIVWLSGGGAFTLPTAASVGAGWFVLIKNLGSGTVTVTPTSGTIDGGSSLSFTPDESAFVISDGTNYFSVGFAASSSSVFDFVSIDVAGAGDFVLTGTNLNRIAYEFTGILTGTRNIVVPNTVQQYWVDNETTGAFSLFVKTALQSPGVEVLQGDRSILYCNGSSVLAAESGTVTFPIPINQGGTGQVTAAAARTALGTVPGTTNFGYLDTPQNSESGNYNIVLVDDGKTIYHPPGAGAGHTYTIPANASIAFPIGATLQFMNFDSNSISIAITTDAMALAGSALTGTRTLAPAGIAIAQKIAATSWVISGVGLT